MHDERIVPLLAIVIGTGIGMLLSVGAQKLLNQQARHRCSVDRPAGHVLIEGRSFIGDTVFCIPETYTKPMPLGNR